MDIYETLFHHSPDAVLLVDESGTIQKMNAQGEKMFGYRPEEYLSQPVELLLPEAAGPAHRQFVAAYVANPAPRPMGSGLDLRGRRKDGTEFAVDVMLSPLPTPTGLLLLAVVRDNTKQRAALNAQLSLINQLQNALKEVRTLRGLLPICSYCKQVRTDSGAWQQLEVYLNAHTDAEFSHGICPACAEKVLTEYRQDTGSQPPPDAG